MTVLPVRVPQIQKTQLHSPPLCWGESLSPFLVKKGKRPVPSDDHRTL